MRLPYLAVMAVHLACLTFAHAQGDALQYPARGVVDLDEGTFECWFKLAYEPLAVVKPYLGAGSIAHVSTGEHVTPTVLDFWISSKWVDYRTPTKMQCSLRCDVIGGGTGMATLSQHAKRNTWYHFAMTWKRDRYLAYIDGKPNASRGRSTGVQARVTDAARIFLGHSAIRTDHEHLFALDEIRISSIARQPDDLGVHGKLEADEYTTLLLSFDHLEDQDRPTVVPDAIAVPFEHVEQAVPARARIIPGRFGQALAFTDKPFEAPD